MGIERLYFGMFILVLLSLGCVTPAPTCNKPYILVGNDCCLDRDDNSICDNDESPTDTTSASETTIPTQTLATATTTESIPTILAPSTTLLFTTATTMSPTTKTTGYSTRPVTAPALSKTTNEISIVYQYFQGSGLIWNYRVPAIADPDDYTSINIQVNNSKNTTFHLHILDSAQTEKCWDSPRFTDCIGGIVDYNSIRQFNGTFDISANYSIGIDNKMEGSVYTIKWTFTSPTANMTQVWDHWKNENRGCLYYGNNGTICETWNYRECWRDDLRGCNQSCCKITRTDKNITWYQKCVSSEEFHRTYNRWPYGYKILDIPDNIWFINKFRDNNCQDATSTFNY